MKEGIQFDSKDKFGRTPIIWAASKGHSRIVGLLLEKYKDARIFIRTEDIPKVAVRPCFTKSHVNCNICATKIADSESYFHCDICQFGDFDICQHCASLGASCLENSHKLVERCVEKNMEPS
jgi:ankyrin repeat protein